MLALRCATRGLREGTYCFKCELSQRLQKGVTNMAIYETTLRGTSIGFVDGLVRNAILKGSATATLEAESHVTEGDVEVRTLVFERYSFAGSNRVSLTVTLVGRGDTVHVSGIASGGSQALIWKINTLGEQAFLDQLVAALR